MELGEGRETLQATNRKTAAEFIRNILTSAEEFHQKIVTISQSLSDLIDSQRHPS